jgi:hypothetical protein
MKHAVMLVPCLAYSSTLEMHDVVQTEPQFALSGLHGVISVYDS